MQLRGREVVVTGIGAVTAHGVGCETLWSAIAEGRDGIQPIRRFCTDDFSVHLGATVPGTESRGSSARTDAVTGLSAEYALDAAREAWAQAAVDVAKLPPERIGLVVGTSLLHVEKGLHRLTENLADTFSMRGPRLTVSTACSSSTNALGLARQLIASGTVDLALAGGMDVLTPEVFAGFHALGILNANPCAPFSRSMGTTLGEGAGFVVLESAAHARRRGCDVIAALSGYGLSGDAYHETAPDPSGAGVARAFAGALSDAGLAADRIGYVNAHGSGTIANDAAEWSGIRKVVGAHAAVLPVSSLKGSFGHAQGAAGVLEAIVTIMAMRRGLIPQTHNLDVPRPQGPPDPVGDGKPRRCDYKHAATLNSAFGGSNAAVILSPPHFESPARTRSQLSVLGVGVVGPHGLDVETFVSSQVRNVPDSRTVPAFDIDRLVPTADPRGLDKMSCFLTAAVAGALADAGVVVKGELRNRTGLVVGVVRPSPSSQHEFGASIERRGLPHLSATAFARVVLNAPGGTCSKLLSLKGPNLTLTTGRGSGLSAIVCAAELLASRDDADVMVAAGADEALPDGWPGPKEEITEGAACLVLGRQANTAVASEPPSICLAGWGMAGPDRADEACAAALAMAKMCQKDVDCIFAVGIDDVGTFMDDRNASSPRVVVLQDVWVDAAASSAAWVVVLAVDAIRRGDARAALVVCGEGESVSTSLLMTSGECADGQ